jgi:ligand-binding sensor domain-containing protein
LPVDSYTTLVFDGQKRLYIGTLHHGVFTSSDGASWKPDNTALPSGTAINELAYDSLQSRLWAATAQGVYRSDSGGAWIALNNGLKIADGVMTIQAAANAAGPVGFVYAGTKRGIFRSTDSGSHWEAAGQLLQGVAVRHILVDFRSANAATLYVGTSFGAFRSDDSGLNWRSVAGGLPEDTPVYAFVIGADNASQLFAAVNNVYAYPGTGSGITPTRIITLLLVALLFVLFFLIAQRSIRGRKRLLKYMDSRQQAKSS